MNLLDRHRLKWNLYQQRLAEERYTNFMLAGFPAHAMSELALSDSYREKARAISMANHPSNGTAKQVDLFRETWQQGMGGHHLDYDPYYDIQEELAAIDEKVANA